MAGTPHKPKTKDTKKPGHSASALKEVSTRALHEELKRRSRTDTGTQGKKADRWTPAGQRAHKYRSGKK